MKKILLFFVGCLSLVSCSSDDNGNPSIDDSGEVRIKSVLRQVKVNGQWKDNTRVTNFFDGSNIMMSSTLTEVMNASNNWENQQRDTYTLDSNQNPVQQIIESWNSSANQWENYQKNTFMFNDLNQQTNSQSQDWQAGQWVDSNRSESTYDSNGNPVLMMWEYYLNGNWGLGAKVEYIYDANGFMQSRTVYGYQNGWLLSSRETATYNSEGQVIQRYGEMYFQGNWYHTYDVVFEEYLQNGFSRYQYMTTYDAFDGHITAENKSTFTFETP